MIKEGDVPHAMSQVGKEICCNQVFTNRLELVAK